MDLFLIKSAAETYSAKIQQLDSYLFNSNLKPAQAEGISLFEYERRHHADPKVKLLFDLRNCYKKLAPDLNFRFENYDYSTYVSHVDSCLEPLLDRASALPADSAQHLLVLLWPNGRIYEVPNGGSRNK